ncbi:hypothetical protein LCGC14_2434980 [marine sediment metagenome]|uniref:Uncharacterized protein n=1 Tax=marine sediment metagenome TaxID=412755 RepID=A0A0F9BKX3_9ZZZZ
MAEDMIEMAHEAFGEFRDRYVETQRAIKSDMVNRPLDPAARKLKGQEKAAHDLAFVSDSVKVMSSAAELRVRFEVAEGKIPRRVGEYVLGVGGRMG